MTHQHSVRDFLFVRSCSIVHMFAHPLVSHLDMKFRKGTKSTQHTKPTTQRPERHGKLLLTLSNCPRPHSYPHLDFDPRMSPSSSIKKYLIERQLHTRIDDRGLDKTRHIHWVRRHMWSCIMIRIPT